ncbi:hypothetical protein K437DRAFT_265561 [Tilletiaria anomala UBC 951]|uniref:Uncharacterized protein n=1 Tax=Tilletiaria anomala (strain ATCC 24038 / CBS 436.72 / UBC 951) TaxID=1037660 RepID=A0A066WI40_TILAU|nr:uncharacterized protein K437DRAFT_265561 [Tilletiaria anomala UBC 951]KDN53491.1 hypothetical protein K437DRAFT_265561 [Tilletiaria anomala UBC 951]
MALSNFFGVAWARVEIAGMRIEGAVRPGLRKELEAIKDEREREPLFKALVDEIYECGKADSATRVLEIGTIIDPVDMRE